MSCIRFDLNSSAARRAALKTAPTLAHSVPEWTTGKARRLEALSQNSNSAIRERAALDPHITAPQALRLATDPVLSVRSALARNEKAPANALDLLSRDSEETVRGFAALNFYLSGVSIDRLKRDESDLVRFLVNTADHAVDVYQPEE